MRLLSVLLFLAAFQESETAATSKVSEAPLPPGALRVLEKNTIAQTATLLQALYKDAKLRGQEVLLWPGDYSGEKGAALRKEAVKLLEKAGYVCREEASDQKIEDREVLVCSAIRQNRRVLGVWVGSAEAALLAWAEDAAGTVGEAVFQNVVYRVPKGWKAEAAADAVTLTPNDLAPEEKLFVLILPGRDFKGDL